MADAAAVAAAPISMRTTVLTFASVFIGMLVIMSTLTPAPSPVRTIIAADALLPTPAHVRPTRPPRTTPSPAASTVPPTAPPTALHAASTPTPTEPFDVPTPALVDTLAPMLDALGKRELRARDELGALLEQMKLTQGVQVGLDEFGDFTRDFLQRWKSMRNFTVIVTESQGWLYNHAKGKMDPWIDRVEWLRMDSTPAAAHFAAKSVDFVFINGRRDYCGCSEDLRTYWSKLRRGGILAGHDFYDNRELPSNLDWSFCADGSEHQRAIKGAVQDFLVEHAESCSRLHVGEDRCYYLQKLSD